MATYEVNTVASTFSTRSSIAAARVFTAKLKSGQNPSVYAKVFVDDSISIRPVHDWSSNVKKMQKLIIAAGKD